MEDTLIESRVDYEEGRKVIYETRVDKRGKIYHVKLISGDKKLIDILEQLYRDLYMKDREL